MGKIKDNIISWMFGAVCAILCGAIALIVAICSAKADMGATVSIPGIKIYIKGEIEIPGLYEIGADTRLLELIEIAGGTTENADIDRLNLAAILFDGTTVIIPEKGSSEVVDPMIAIGSQTGFEPEESKSSGSPDKITSGTININSASKSELMRLPGIGEATAQKIISYREEKGNFLSIEEIMNVSGIGEKKFETMKSYLAVE